MAQDLHFSQYYAVPMTLNPALTGAFNEDFRVSGIHRRQWQNINAGFLTTAIGFDMNFDAFGPDRFGIGVYAYNDQMGEGVFKNNSFSLAGAYHRVLGKQQRSHLSFGIQGGYASTNLDGEGLIFEDQYKDFKLSGSTLEDLNRFNTGNINLHAGLNFSHQLSAKANFNLGASIFHISSPKSSLLEGEENKLGRRMAAHATFNYKLTERLVISPKFFFMTQSADRIIMPGLMADYLLIPSQKLYLLGGVWDRLGDALIVMGGLRFKNIEARVSYDATMSGLKDLPGVDNFDNATPVNAWEIGITWVGRFRNGKGNYTVPCGIF